MRSPAASVGSDYNANTETAVSALQQWYVNTNGLWNSTGWWNAANCVDALANDIVANNDLNYLPVLQNTFNMNSGANFLNEYYDDEGWWTEAWIRSYDLTGNVQYLNMAKTIFADMTNAWDSECGGGLWWSKALTYKNAIPNELFLLDAIRLHQRTPGDAGAGSYFYWATNEWAWFKNTGMINSQNLINDGLTSDCVNNGETTWTYNQGVILGGLTDLYKVTGNTNYLAQAEAIASAATTRLVSSAGVLQEPCEVTDSCGGGDVPQFKGIFVRNLAYLYDVDLKPAYSNFFVVTAHSVWFEDRNSSNQFGLPWTGAFDSADAARQSSAINPLSALAEPVTSLLFFAKGSADPAFNHAVGSPSGTLAWQCQAGTPYGLMQWGPYISSLPVGAHVVHVRMAVNTVSNSISYLAQLTIRENNTGTVLATTNVAWNSFMATNQAQDFPLSFTNAVAGDPLEFGVNWNNAAGAPTLTLSDVTIDGYHNWLAANLTHDIGRLDGLNGWEADPVRAPASGYLTRGPGTAELPAGNYKAQFELKVDNFNWDSTTVAMLSVVNVDSNVVVASRAVARTEFPDTLYHPFAVNFSTVPGAHYDYRVYWYYATNAPRLTQRSVVVKPAGAAAFVPIPLKSSSYTEDMVVERTAPAVPNGLHTTASMDAGTANTGNGWYEAGYDTSAAATGLPAAGSTITNQSASDHLYTFASSYTVNNVAYVDSSHSSTLTPVNPAAYDTLSLLLAAGHGPVIVDYKVNHADGSAEAGVLNVPDWFFNAPVAWDAEGRVDVGTGTFNNVNNSEPRLYSADIALTNTASSVNSINLTWDKGNSGTGVVAAFAMSGTPPYIPPPLLFAAFSAGFLTLTWSNGLLLQASSLSGPWTTNAAASPYQLIPSGPSMFYRVQAP